VGLFGGVHYLDYKGGTVLASKFRGFPPEAMEFFRGLARHNTREWFQPRKQIFEETVRQPMLQLVEALNGELLRFAPLHATDPEKAIFRFYRDTRFSKDKSPYKDRIAATFPRRGMVRHQGAMYYFSVNDKGVAMGGGLYMPMPETLLAVRNHIAVHHEDMRAIIAAKPPTRLYGELQGESLARVPKGFPATHPAAGLLKRKHFFYYVETDPQVALTPALVPLLRKHFEAITPLVDFLNSGVVGKKKPGHE